MTRDNLSEGSRRPVCEKKLLDYVSGSHPVWVSTLSNVIIFAEVWSHEKVNWSLKLEESFRIPGALWRVSTWSHFGSSRLLSWHFYFPPGWADNCSGRLASFIGPSLQLLSASPLPFNKCFLLWAKQRDLFSSFYLIDIAKTLFS